VTPAQTFARISFHNPHGLAVAGCWRDGPARLSVAGVFERLIDAGFG